jgi:hypothetical protein
MVATCVQRWQGEELASLQSPPPLLGMGADSAKMVKDLVFRFCGDQESALDCDQLFITQLAAKKVVSEGGGYDHHFGGHRHLQQQQEGGVTASEPMKLALSAVGDGGGGGGGGGGSASPASSSPSSPRMRGSNSKASGGESKPVKVLPCPRCESMNTKFCYYNNYSANQPRHFCRQCRRYWTAGGTLRNVPVGGGSRKKSRQQSRSLISDPYSLHGRGVSSEGIMVSGALAAMAARAGGSSVLQSLELQQLMQSANQDHAVLQGMNFSSQLASVGGGGGYHGLPNPFAAVPSFLDQTPGVYTTTTTQPISSKPKVEDFSSLQHAIYGGPTTSLPLSAANFFCDMGAQQSENHLGDSPISLGVKTEYWGGSPQHHHQVGTSQPSQGLWEPLPGSRHTNCAQVSGVEDTAAARDQNMLQMLVAKNGGCSETLNLGLSTWPTQVIAKSSWDHHQVSKPMMNQPINVSSSQQFRSASDLIDEAGHGSYDSSNHHFEGPGSDSMSSMWHNMHSNVQITLTR